MKFVFLLFLMSLVGMMWGRSRFLKIYAQESAHLIRSRITGGQLAEAILRKKEISGVTITKGIGLTPDFYNPTTRCISLAPQHLLGSTFSALAIAALQAGKAIQHHEGHKPLLWRVGAIQWSVYIAPLLALMGLISAVIAGKTIFPVVLGLWTIIALWNLLTIPTEIDAGIRARRVLAELRPFRDLDERVGVERVIGAASTAYIDGISVLGSWLSRFLPGKQQDENRQSKHPLKKR